MKRVIVYGIGRNCFDFLKFAHNRDFEIVAYVDANKAGQCYEGKVVLKPSDLCALEYEELFLTVCFGIEDIVEWLVREIGVDISKIRDAMYLNMRYMLAGIQDYKYIFLTNDLGEYDYLNLPYEDLKQRGDVTFRAILQTDKKWKSEKSIREMKGCFLYRSHCYNSHKQTGFYEYMKTTYPSAKHILILSDMCGGEFGYERKLMDFSVIDNKNHFDKIFTYHSADAQKYGLIHLTQPFSKIELKEEAENVDLFFAGNAKNRLTKVHRLYLEAKKQGLKCNFWINGVAPGKMLQCEDIIYNQKLSYLQYLREMKRCRCIVEICQAGNESSMRFAEAVVYNKMLLVDDATCRKRKFYDEKYMQCFEQIDDIDFEWIKKTKQVEYGYDGSFSPIHLLKYIEQFF